MIPIDETGGPAFPCDHYKPNPMLTAAPHPGMSLRDLFAAAVLQGVLANPNTQAQGAPTARFDFAIAGRSYQIADAMIQARKEGA
jgi:hypothetical protein